VTSDFCVIFYVIHIFVNDKCLFIIDYAICFINPLKTKRICFR
jgi:hypothetical protein